MLVTERKGRDGLRRSLSTGSVFFVLGAGVAVHTSGMAPTANWLGLLENGLQECRKVDPKLPTEWSDTCLGKLRDTDDPDAMIDVAEEIERILKARKRYSEWLVTAVGSLHVQKRDWIEAIASLGTGIATTNYDSLIEDTLKLRAYVTWRSDFSEFREVFVNERRGIIHLHGHYADPRSVILGKGSYDEIVGDDVAQEMMRQLTLGKILVFVGYGAGLSDPNFVNIRRMLRKLEAGRRVPHYRLVLDEQVDDVVREHQGEDFEILGYGPDYADLPHYLGEIGKRRRQTPKGRARSMIGLPEPSRVPLIGRQALINHAISGLRAGSDIALVGGLPGVGKTATALAIARDARLRSTFPDGVLWAGLGQRPDVLFRLMSWARSLGIAAGRVGATGSKKTQIKRVQREIDQVLADRCVLIVIDDAWAADDAYIFRLGSVRSGHLLTTRQYEIGDEFSDGEVIHVSELDEEECFALIVAVAPEAAKAREGKIRTILPVSGGLPIALNIIAGQIRVGWAEGVASLDNLLGKLSDFKARLDLLQRPGDRIVDQVADRRVRLTELLAMSEARLTTETRRALRDIAVFPPKVNTFSAEAAETVSGQSFEAVQSLLRVGLLESGGVVPKIGQSRYQIHQAVADYARHAKGDPHAWARLVEFFARHLASVPSGRQRASWLNSLELELRNIEAGFEWALSHGDRDGALSIAAGLGVFWYEKSRFAEGMRWNSRVVEGVGSTESTKQSVLVAKVINDLGNFAYNQGDHAAAHGYYIDSYNRRKALPGKPDVAGSLNNLSLIERVQGRFAQARLHLLLALRINAQHLTDDGALAGQARLWTAVNLNNLGIVSLAQANAQEAAGLQERSIDGFTRLEHNWGVAMATCDLGNAKLELGQPSEARALYSTSLALRLPINDTRGIATTLRALGFIDLIEGDVARGTSLYAAALRLSVDLGDAWGAADAMLGIASLTAEEDLGAALVLETAAATYYRNQAMAPSEILTVTRLRLQERASESIPRRQRIGEQVDAGQPRVLLADARLVANSYLVDPLSLAQEMAKASSAQ